MCSELPTDGAPVIYYNFTQYANLALGKWVQDFIVKNTYELSWNDNEGEAPQRYFSGF